jgi:hypothetical protein
MFQVSETAFLITEQTLRNRIVNPKTQAETHSNSGTVSPSGYCLHGMLLFQFGSCKKQILIHFVGM